MVVVTVDEEDVSEYVDRLPRITGALDEHRNPIESFGPPERVGIIALDPGGSIDPRRAEHPERTITTPTIYALFGSPFVEHDRVLARGVTYVVDGKPDRWIDEDGVEVGDVINLRKVTA